GPSTRRRPGSSLCPSTPLPVTAAFTRPAHAHAAWGAVCVDGIEWVPRDAGRRASMLRGGCLTAERILGAGYDLKVARIHAMADPTQKVGREPRRNRVAVSEIRGGAAGRQ